MINIKVINIPKVQVEMDKETFDVILKLIGESLPCQRKYLFKITKEESDLLSNFYIESKYYRENHK